MNINVKSNQELKPGVKDAIHVPIISVEAGERLEPGKWVMLSEDVALASDINAIGIVNPFKDDIVFQGECFWMLLFPGTVTNLRHEWDHPGINDPKEAEKFIEEAAQQCGMTYKALMNRAEAFAKYDEPINVGEVEDYKHVDWDRFWECWSQVTGKEPPEGSPFSCSC